MTGASSGLGRAVALKLADEGAAVAVNHSRSDSAARDVVDQIRAVGARGLSVRADVSSPTAVASMAKEVQRKLGPVEFLVANAGVTEYVPFEDVRRITKRMWDRILGVNLVGAFLCVQAVVAQMRAAGSGSIVLVSSNSAFTARGSSIPYVVSKAGVISLAHTLAHALAPSIRVNAVAPGWMPTPWLDKYLPEEVQARLLLDDNAVTAVEDVAESVVHVLANESISGSVLLVDGGEGAVEHHASQAAARPEDRE